MAIAVMAMAVVADVAVVLAITQVLLLVVATVVVSGLSYSFLSSVVAVAIAFPQIITADVIIAILVANLSFQKRRVAFIGNSPFFDIIIEKFIIIFLA